MERIDIQIFQAIIKYKNIQKASEALYMSATTVGTRLKNLEDELGVQLFTRAKGIKNVTLTEKGKQFIPLTNQMLSAMDACDALKEMNERIPITIATADGFLNEIFYSFYCEMMQGQYDLDIQRYPSDMIWQMVANHKADIGFALFKVQQKDVKAKALFEEDFVVIVKDDGSYTDSFITPDDLDPEEEYLVADEDNIEDNIYVGAGPEVALWHREHFDIDARAKLRVNNFSMVHPFLYDSHYWMLVSLSNAMELKKHYPIKILELRSTMPKSVCYLLKNRSLSNKKREQIEQFSHALTEHLSEYEQINLIK